MKEIVHNDSNLNEADINKTITRAKIIIENDNEEILLANSHHDYFFIGGHVDEGESLKSCLTREIKEETGNDINLDIDSPFMSITYFQKDYPNIGDNTKYIAYYFAIKYNLVPNLKNLDLTTEEKKDNFSLYLIPLAKIIPILEESLENSLKRNVTLDTLDVLKEYIKIRKK